MKRLLIFWLLGCGGGRTTPADAGVADAGRAGHDSRARAQAALALGRAGGARAGRQLVFMLADPDVEVRAAVVEALGASGSKVAAGFLADLPPDPLMLQALGRVGTVAEVPALVAALDDARPGVRAAAGRALGVLGRRKVPFGATARGRLSDLRRDADAAVRFAVAYALGREEPAERDAKAEAALTELCRDPDPETRAVALKGLARRGVALEAELRVALDDPDWRIRVEAVRALCDKRFRPELRATLAHWLAGEWRAIADLRERLLSARVHPVLEGLAALRPFARETAVASLFERLWVTTDVTDSTVKQHYTPDLLRSVDAVNCLAAAGLVAGGASIEKVLRCGHPGIERKQLSAELVGEGFGPESILGDLWGDEDPRTRAAAAAAAAHREGPIAARILREALVHENSIVAGSAADSLGRKTAADASLIELVRARVSDASLDLGARLSMLDVLCQGEVELGEDRRFRCPQAEPVAESVAVEVAAPVSPETFAGRRVAWHVETSKGGFDVELDSQIAPRNVATLTSLAQKGFFDGTAWHRVVPNFVVQGGDPTASGWGGPGFVVPSEPSSRRYGRGAIGVADSGRDTGGSQWFITHSAAPHLELRYTLVGQVTAGMDVVDALVVGDKILGVKVTVSSP